LLAFVDESGDTGRKILNRSSRYFVIAVVIFHNNEDALACEYAIQRLRHSLGLPARYEFHYAQNHRRIKEAFLEAVASHRFGYYTFAVDKGTTNTFRLRTAFSEGMYKFAARRVFEIAKPCLTQKISVIIDEIGGKRFRNDLVAHLRSHITDDAGNTLIGDVKIHRSSGNELIQLADYVAGITNRSLRGSRQEVEYRERYLLQHERDHEVWPGKAE